MVKNQFGFAKLLCVYVGLTCYNFEFSGQVIHSAKERRFSYCCLIVVHMVVGTNMLLIIYIYFFFNILGFWIH